MTKVLMFGSTDPEIMVDDENGSVGVRPIIEPKRGNRSGLLSSRYEHL